jgi:Carboxypeptidase regulatory-like domain/TonB dependent receptor-like, beta-barrel
VTQSSSSTLVASFYPWRMLIAFVCSLFLVSFPVLAQNSTGRIIGTVTDAQGAAIAGAKVTVTNTATNFHWETVSGSDGTYQVLELPIGNYSVTAEHEGFTKVVTAALPLEINQSLRIDVHMKVGSVAEVVRVEAAAVQVETVNPTVGGTVTGATVQNLPLNGRNTLDLALTMPGVTQAPPIPIGGSGIPTGGLSIAGGRDDSVTYLLDGGNNTALTYGAPVVSPNPDTVAEFRILSNNYTAEFGRSAGGVVSVVTKSGTNDFHGSVFDYLRNDAFNANNFFNKSNGSIQPRPVLKRNQFGGTLGGPITIPNVLNGKDRFFFFFGYQGQRQTSVTVGNVQTVYTPAELTGDFSHSGPGGGSDPGVVKFLTNHPFFVPAGGSPANGIIDPAKINPVAQAYIAAGIVPSSSSGLLTPNGSGTDNRDEYTGKFDFNATQNDRISLTLTKFHNPVTYPFLLSQAPNVSGFPAKNQFDDYFGNLNYTKTISQTMLNEFHMTAQRAGFSLNFPARKLPGPADLGVKVTPDQVTGPPQILLNVSGPQLGFNINGPAYYGDTTYVYADTFSWTRGRHTWKFGGGVGIVQNNAFFDFAVDGIFAFNGPFGIGSGNDRADFLIGAPDIFEQFPRGLSAIRSHQYSVFAQDEWKVTPRLVLTLGVRYEYNTPKSDPQKRQYMIIPGLQSVRYPNAPTGLVFTGDPGTSSGIPFPDKNNWAPRIGFAWDPRGDGKTSVRGGFGMFYDVLLGLDNQFQNGTPPFFAAAFLGIPASAIPANGPSPILSDPYGSAGFTNPFPSSSLPPPQQLNFATVGFLPFGPSSVLNNPHVVTPYIFQYNLSVQRQLGSGLVAEIGYVGSSSHKLTTVIDQDPIDLKTGVRVLNEQPNLNIPGAWGSAVGTGNGANANYNGMLASLTKRVGDWHSLGQTFFTLAYTWSHELDDSSGQFRNTQQVPAYNHHQFYSSGDSDVRNRLVLSGGWELPFAHLFQNGPKALTNGWSLYPIVFVQSGLPMDVDGGLSIFNLPNPSGAGDQNLVKPNWTGGSPQTLDPHQVQTISVPGVPAQLTGHFIFNPNDLSVPACYLNAAIPCPTFTYGTLGRNFFRGPRRVNFDLSLEKRTKFFGERVEMTLRGEFFNILNHTEWQNPPTGPALVSSPQLGQVVSTFDPRIGQVSLRFAF